MLIKIYLALWALFMTLVAGLFVTGNLTNLAIVIVGFMTMPLIFAGMIIVLPLTIAHSRNKPAELNQKSGRPGLRWLSQKIAATWSTEDMAVRQLRKHRQAG